MITERCRMNLTDTVLIFLAAFVLVSTLLAPRVPLQKIIVIDGQAVDASYAVPISHSALPSIQNRLDSYGKVIDHPLLGTNRWIVEASRYYVNAAEPLWQGHDASTVKTPRSSSQQLSIQQVSHQPTATHAKSPHEPAKRSWDRIAAEAEARIIQIQNHQSAQLKNLGPAPVKLGGRIRVFWTASSLMTAFISSIVVLILVIFWNRIYPTRQLQSLSVPGDDSANNDHQWIAIDVLPEWIRLHQTSGAIMRRSFVAVLVLSSMISLGISFTA